MRRVAIEAVVATSAGPFRVTTTHLEFHSPAQRLAQVDMLRALHQEACANTAAPPSDPGEGTYAVVPRPPEAMVCGDFNFEVDAPEYARMSAPFADGSSSLRDAWRICHGDRPHDPTCGIHDRDQWPQGDHTRDFFFVSDVLAPRVRDVVVDTKTNASDHQPVLLVLDP
jgi:endonuclease/exonuclease/phosphatase family metal-dependent hydrolase